MKKTALLVSCIFLAASVCAAESGKQEAASVEVKKEVKVKKNKAGKTVKKEVKKETKVEKQ